MSDVSELLARIARGQDGGQLALDGRDGVEGELARAVNELSRRLELTRAELHRSQRDLQTYATAVSHDLRSPLHTMNGFASLLQRFCGDRLEATGRDYLSYITGAVETQLTLLNGLTAWARVYSRGDAAGTVEMSWLRGAALNELGEVEIGNNEVRWGDLPAAIVGDRGQLAAALGRLIANGLLYRKEPGTVEVSGERHGDEWRFAVRDDGIGIAEEYLGVVLDPCKRLHTAEEFPGVGMGLAIAARIARRHGGRVWLESEPGRGTTAFLAIPTAPKLHVLAD
jgi:light-regulated signal transduction histidine kinase (bacteriophytochrome)